MLATVLSAGDSFVAYGQSHWLAMLAIAGGAT